MDSMRVVVLHGAVPADAPPDERDVLVEVETVCAALRGNGYEVETLGVGRDLGGAARGLRRADADVVFNLVESLDGRGELIALVPSLLEHLGLPYSGCPAHAILLTSNKLTAKAAMRAAGVATPAWLPAEAAPAAGRLDRPYIVKSVWEHASIGLDGASVVTTAANLAEAIRSLQNRVGGQVFCEQFIDGREFNISMLETDNGPRCLPPAEILFEGWPGGHPRIVGYQAKWDESSPEYQATVRRFDFHAGDRALLGRVVSVALRCWEVFDLHGYARVDFRIDGEGRPWVLEVNTNPCLSPDAGFMAAADRAGLSGDDVVTEILARATEPGSERAVSHGHFRGQEPGRYAG